MTEQEQTGIVFGIQRFSIHDGPGIRTTVFLKGCNVACRWCHNPEGIPLQPLLSYDVQKCTACGACASVCPNGCHEFKGGVHHLERASCALCGACVRACPNGALSQIGDLAASLVKRDCGVKDFGKIFPGHGGVMDRLDGILFATLACYVFFRMMG